MSNFLIASQAWCLARLFPLILFMGSVNISENDKHWLNFLLLLTISDYLLSPVTSIEAMTYVKVLIDEHHREFTDLYPLCPIIPKMHYLIHYPDWIMR